MSVFKTGWPQLIVAVYPLHHRSGIAPNFGSPVCRVGLLAAYLIQGLKSFPASGMLSLDTELSEVFNGLLPFAALWS